MHTCIPWLLTRSLLFYGNTQALSWLRQLFMLLWGLMEPSASHFLLRAYALKEHCFLPRVGLQGLEGVRGNAPAESCYLAIVQGSTPNGRLSFPYLNLSLFFFCLSLFLYLSYLFTSPYDSLSCVSPSLSLSASILPSASLRPSGADGMPFRAPDRHVECGRYFAGAVAGSAAFPHRGFARGAPDPNRLRVRAAAAEAVPSWAFLFGVLRA